MVEMGLLVVGLIVGAVLGCVAAILRHKSAEGSRWIELEARAQKAETTAEERTRLAQEYQSEVEKLRSAVSQEQQQRVAALTRLEEARASIEAQRKLLDEAKEQFRESFRALSAEALEGHHARFGQLAEASLKPLRDALQRYETQIHEMERKREGAYSTLGEQLRALGQTHQHLQAQTGNLVAALRSPQVRGRWGEMTLRRVVELAGMSEHCDYDEQFSVDGEQGKLRPDLVVQLPAARQIVVDAKVPLSAYLDAMAALSEEDRRQALIRHAQQVRRHMELLASKPYWKEFLRAPEFVVLFLPGEPFFAAALEHNTTLIEDAIAQRVVLATPTTLIALLRAIAYGWREERLAKNAQEISNLGRELHGRLKKFVEHLEKVGSGLRQATQAYNGAVGSLESRLLPSARRFQELGAATEEEIPPLQPVDEAPRALAPQGRLPLEMDTES